MTTPPPTRGLKSVAQTLPDPKSLACPRDVAAAPDFDEASTLLQRSRRMENRFQLNALVAQVLFVQLHEYAESQYSTGHPGGHKLQTGQARRGFSKLFEPLSAIERVRLFENLLRFANHEEYAPARGFFLAYAPLSFEHDLSGEYIGPGVWKLASGARTAALRVTRTLNRWCDWLEALTHFQVHQLHHSHSTTMELDKAIILLWPLRKRHGWTYEELLGLLRANSQWGRTFPCQTADQFAAYCRNFLGLWGENRMVTAKNGKLPGHHVAERLLRFLPSIS